MLNLIIQAFFETMTMVGVSAAISFCVGLPLGIVLVTTREDGLWPLPRFNRVLSVVINALRATPFVILLVAMIPLTRAVVGTSIGVWAAILPLSANLIPYFARVTEISLREVDKGLIEAALAMGCERWHIVRYVLIPEAMPGLVGGATLTLIGLINSSAIAGVIGAGGLGDLAIRYGYQLYDTTIMTYIIVILVMLVTMIQFSGDFLVRKLNANR